MPRDEDLAFVRTLLNIKGHLREEYVRDIDDATLRKAAIDGMLGLATDRHTEYVPPVDTKAFEDGLAGRFDGVGVIVEAANVDDPEFSSDESASGGLVIVYPIPGSPAAQAGLVTGDRIVGVDGVEVLDAPQDAVIKRITGPTGTRVDLAIERMVPETGATTSFDVSVTRAAVEAPVLEGASRQPDGSPVFMLTPNDLPAGMATGELPRIAYIRLTQFTPNSADAILTTLRRLGEEGGELDGFILDLRNNPGGLLDESIKLLDLFIDEGVLTWSEGEHSPRRTWNASPEVAGVLGGAGRELPLVVLVDRTSASASEVTAGALSNHGRATIVGERSYGKGSVQDIITLDDTGRLKMTTAYYHLPNGRIVDRQPGSAGGGVWGIDPDVPALVDFSDPATIGNRGGLPIPGPVWRAYEVLLAQLAASDRAGIWTPVSPRRHEDTE